MLKGKCFTRLFTRITLKYAPLNYHATLEYSMIATVEQLAPVEQQATSGWVVAALYQFKEVQDPADLQQRLLDFVIAIDLCGFLLVDGEGIVCTVLGDCALIDHFLRFLSELCFVEM